MRGTQAKKLRRVARTMCNPQANKMHGKKYRIAARPVVDAKGEQMVDPATGQPLIVPETVHITAFWPNGSYRRLLRSMKKYYHLDPIQRAAMLEMGARDAAPVVA